MDAEQKKKAIILGVLVLALPVLLWWFVFRTSPDEAAFNQAQAANQNIPGTPPIQSVFAQNPVDINELFASIQEVSFSYANEQIARDPMIAVSGAQIGIQGPDSGLSMADEPVVYVAQRLEVTGIIWDEDDPIAVINDGSVDNIVEVGFIYPNFNERLRIKSIGKDHVVVEVILSDGEAQEFRKELKEQ